VTPRSLSAIKPPPGFGGRPGRTLIAVLDTLLDLNRQVIAATLQADTRLPSGASFGGLHGGYARLSSSSIVLHHLSFVNGVQLSGSFPVRGGRLVASTIRISGASASHGSVRLGSSSRRVTGSLDGRRFDLSISIARAKLSRAGRAAGEEPLWPGSVEPLSKLGRTPADGRLQYPHS
jgi:hypothetical protein